MAGTAPWGGATAGHDSAHRRDTTASSRHGHSAIGLVRDQRGVGVDRGGGGGGGELFARVGLAGDFVDDAQIF